jgi:hypothetical protein
LIVQDSLHSLLDYKCLRFQFDLVLIPSASVVWWLTLHSGALNSLANASKWIHQWTLVYISGWTEERPPPATVHLLLCLLFGAGTCLPNRCPAMDYSVSVRCLRNVFTEPLFRNGHIRRYMIKAYWIKHHTVEATQYEDTWDSKFV